MSLQSTARTHRSAVTAVRGTSIVFVGAGFAFATWASRIPQVRAHLQLSPQRLGVVLLAIAVGSIVALVLGGAIVHRFGSQRVVASASVVTALGLAGAGLGYLDGVWPLVAGLAVLGFGYGSWDVAMNVQGASAERLLGRSVMPRFHAGYSVGTVAGALIGAAAEALHVPVVAHLGAAALVLLATVPFATRMFAPDLHDAPDLDDAADIPDGPYPNDGPNLHGTPDSPDRAHIPAATPAAAGSAFRRWREPRTVLIGVFVLAFSFAEGTGNDWIGVSFISGHHTSAVVGTLGFATFLAAMTTGRWFGPRLLDRLGRVPVVRTLAAVAVAGLVVYVFSPLVWLAFLGALLWGVGASLGFPVGMSAAADEPAAAAGRVSVVAAIGYFAFLGGPPLIGFLGQHTSVLHALTAAAVLLAAAILLAGAVREPKR